MPDSPPEHSSRAGASRRGQGERVAASEDLEDELRRRLERLEERVAMLRRSLPASLSLARLRRATAELARLEEQGTLHSAGATGEGAKALVLRLGRAVDELELLLREVSSATV